MKDMQLAGVLLIGLVIGYLVGLNRNDPPAVLPINYDSTRSLCLDAMKLQQGSTDSCWQHVVTLLQQKGATDGSAQKEKTD